MGQGRSASLHTELHKQLMDLLRGPRTLGAEQSPADIHARSSKSMGSFGQFDNAQTAHEQLDTVLAHCTSTGEQTDITQAVHTSRALWLAWPAKPRTCKSTKVLGAVCSTTDMVQLASTSTVLSMCSPKAARRVQDILCFMATGRSAGHVHIARPSLQWKHAGSRRYGQASRRFGRQHSNCKITWRQSRSALFNRWPASYGATVLMTSSNIPWPMSVLPATLTARRQQCEKNCFKQVGRPPSSTNMSWQGAAACR